MNGPHSCGGSPRSSVCWPPCALGEDTSWRDPCAALDFLAPHFHSIRQGGLGHEVAGVPGPSHPMAQSVAALTGQNPCSTGERGGGSEASVPVPLMAQRVGRNWFPPQTWQPTEPGHPLPHQGARSCPSSSDGCGLLDAVETDTGRGGGDGHSTGHTGADGVLVLPSVPPLPDGRADLWVQSRP